MKALVFSLLCLAACGSDSVPRDLESPDAGGLEDASVIPLDGAAIYAERCARCHGEDGSGTMKGPQILSPVPAYAAYVIKNGRNAEMGFPGKMPAFADRLGDADIAAVVGHLSKATKPATGAALYARFCGNCHGADAGGGRVGQALAKAEINAAWILRKVRRGAGGSSFEMREEFMPAWVDTDLTDGEVTLIVEHIASLSSTVEAKPLVINEVDYDQVGVDNAEYIEIYNPGPAPVSLAGKQVVLVNGGVGEVYQTIDLGTGSLAAGAYLVIGGPGVTVTAPATKLDPGWTTDKVQNGTPDAVALIDSTSHTLIDSLSYEGGLTAVSLPGFTAPVSLVSGTALAATTFDSNVVDGAIARTPNGTDSGNDATDWKFGAKSPGLPNP